LRHVSERFPSGFAFGYSEAKWRTTAGATTGGGVGVRRTSQPAINVRIALQISAIGPTPLMHSLYNGMTRLTTHNHLHKSH
jgi:hypothetical protein